MKKVIVCVLVPIICLSSCKKYDESNLWFKNPRQIAFIDGNMTHWIVNGVDSIDYLDNYFYNDIYGNPYSHKFSDLTFWSQKHYKGIYEIVCYKPNNYAFPYEVVQSIDCEYSKDGKTIKLYRTKHIINGFKKNIFISDDIIWEITYLKRKDKKRKMKGTYNGNTYEIQFN